MDPETIPMKCSYLVSWSLLHSDWVFYLITSCIGSLENTALLSYVELPDVDTFHYTVFKNKWLLISSKKKNKSSIIGKLSSSGWKGPICKKFCFSLKSSSFVIGNKYYQLWALTWKTHCGHFCKKISAKSSSLMAIVRQLSFQVKTVSPGNSWFGP